MSSSPRSGFCGGRLPSEQSEKNSLHGDGWGMVAISYVTRLDLRECLPRRTDGCEGDGSRLSRRLPARVTGHTRLAGSGEWRYHARWSGRSTRLTSRSRRGYGCNNMCGRTGCCRAMCWIKIYQFLSFVNLNPVSRPAPRPDARAPHTLTRSRNRRTRPEALPAAVRGPGKRRGSF